MSLNIKLTVILLFSLLSQYSFGQKYSVHKEKKSYFGFTAGFNFSIPQVTDRYSVLNSVGSDDDEELQKKYDKFGKNSGGQFGIRYSYGFTNAVSGVVGFGYQSLGFKYFTHYSWSDTLSNHDFNREMHHIQKISYFTVPLMVRWDMTRAQFEPYLQGGLFMDFRHHAKKEIFYDNTIDEKETENEISTSGRVAVSEQFRKFNMGLTGGAGLSYYTKWVVYSIETNFRFGFLKVINDNNRFADETGFALQYLDVMDQLRLSNLNVQFSVSIPINQSVSLNILRRSKYYK